LVAATTVAVITVVATVGRELLTMAAVSGAVGASLAVVDTAVVAGNTCPG
jgi:hypothetical protein